MFFSNITNTPEKNLSKRHEVPHRFIYLNTWFIVDETVWEILGDVPLGLNFGVLKTPRIPSSFSLSGVCGSTCKLEVTVLTLCLSSWIPNL